MLYNDGPRMYVVLREDLAYKYIQGQHGLAQYALDHPVTFRQWGNQTVINVSVFNGIALEELRSELEGRHELMISKFYEPDLGDALTSIVVFENGDGTVKNALSRCKMATR